MTGIVDAGVLVVTGTDTGVGKTIVTAALAARALASGRSVAVLKPAQTGTAAFEPGETSDVDTVARLAGPAVTCVTLADFPDPLAPLSAAQVSGRPELYLADALEAVAKLAEQHDLVLVEGAGGLLVPMGFDGWTIADLAIALSAPAVVVARAGLGTLNHTALTLEAMRHRGIAGSVVIGAWPAEPDLVHERNLIDLGVPITGVLPEGAGQLDHATFAARAPGWFGAG
ncbi:MAG TPA: dethiobiotin synthase [Micromonosporaceae bacterium]|jgi:dethiobiotin synthetase